jgi:glucan biosynthesis protein C
MLLGGAMDSMANVPKPVLFAIMAASGIGPLWYIVLEFMDWDFSLDILSSRMMR